MAGIRSDFQAMGIRLTIGKRDIRPARCHVAVSWANNFAGVDELLNTVRAPARNAGDGKNRRIKFHWQVEHAVDKAAVKINIRADAFIDFAFFSNDLRGKLCNGGIELIFIRAALFLRQPLYKAFKDIGARVGERINSVPHSVNQAGAVKCLFVQELFEVNGDTLRVVSLDGHRMAIRKIVLKDEYESTKVIVPGKTLNEISKILTGDNEKEVQIFFGANHILFEFDDTIVVSRLIEGEYFKVDQMLSSDYATKVTLNKKDFLDSIERAIILIRENDKKPIILNIEDSKMSLKLNSSFGTMNAEILIHKTGQDLMIGFNPKFLSDALRIIDDEEVTLYMMNAKSPCFIKDEEENYIYLILPVNFNAAAI